MRSFVLFAFVLVMAFLVIGCQGFLDDYNYSPVGFGSMQSSPTNP